MQKRRCFLWDTTVGLKFNLSKGGKGSPMHGLCSQIQRELLLLTPTANRITAYEHVCASTSILVWKWGAMKRAVARGWREWTHNWPTNSTGFGKSGAKSGSGRFRLCPSPAVPEVPPVQKFLSRSLKSFQQSYLEPDDVIEHLRGFSRLPVYPQ